MSYQEKRTLVSLFSGVALLAVYLIFILPQYQLGVNSSDLKFWATTILYFVGISIVLNIVIQIVFHILLSISIAVNEAIEEKINEPSKSYKVDDQLINKKIKLEMIEDERDQIIELKSLRFGYYFSGAGLLIALFTLAMELPAAIMLNVVFLTFMLGSLIEGIAKYYYYKRNN